MKTLLLLIAIILLTVSGACSGQSNGAAAQSRGMFQDVLTNTTDPGVVMGARRGVIYGGDFQMRNKLMNVNLIAFDPPHITAGCGGIDAFMGSFSFISKAQLVAALRSIATAAIGYAFRLALQSMCPSCEKIMSSLQAKMDSMNAGSIDSCRISQQILNAGGTTDSIAGRIEAAGAPIRVATGHALDWFDAQGQNSGVTPLSQLGDPERTEIVAGNLVWRALMQQNTATWAANADNSNFLAPFDLLEDIQSLTGTMVVCEQGKDDCGAGAPSSSQLGETGPALVHVFQPSLNIVDLVEGSTTGRSVTRLKCGGTDPHGATGCTNITRTADPNFIGLKSEILTVMLGPSGTVAAGVKADNSLGVGNGMISDIRAGNAPTSAELSLLQFGGANIQMAVKLAIVNQYAASEFVLRFADQIASDLAFHIMMSDIDAGLTALNQNVTSTTNLVPMRAMINRAVQVNLELKAKYDRSGSAKNGALEYYKQVSSSLDKPLPNYTPAG